MQPYYSIIPLHAPTIYSRQILVGQRVPFPYNSREFCQLCPFPFQYSGSGNSRGYACRGRGSVAGYEIGDAASPLAHAL